MMLDNTMLDWNPPDQQQPMQPAADQQPEGAPYPPPARACFVCGYEDWEWDGERYHCGSEAGRVAHAEHARWLLEIFPPAPKALNEGENYDKTLQEPVTKG